MLLQLKDRWNEHEQQFVTGIGRRRLINRPFINYYDYDHIEYNSTDLTIKHVLFDDEGNPLVPIEYTEYEYFMVANRFRAFFNKAIDGVKLASFHFDNADGIERWVDYCPIGITPVSEVIEGNKITYVDCFPGVDIQYIVKPTMLKMNIIYKTRDAVRDLEILPDLSEGLEIIQFNDGRIGFRDIETEEVLFETTVLDAWDSGVPQKVSTAFHYNIVNGIINIVIDDWAWFDTVTYPVILDPSTSLTTVSGPDDGHIMRGFGMIDATATTFSIGSFSAVYDAFVRWDNVGVPKDVEINSAFIGYHFSSVFSGTNVLSRMYFNDEADAVAPTSESEYNAKLLTTASVDWQLTDTMVGFLYSPDIKGLVQEIVNKSGWASGNALMLLHKTISGDGLCNITSYEGGSNLPELIIDYTELPQLLQVTVQPDPTAGKDTWTASWNPNSNNGTNTSLIAGSYDGTSDSRGFIQFPISLPAGSIVHEGFLELYLSGHNAGAVNICVHEVTSTWAENTLTHNLQPSFNPEVEASIPESGVVKWHQWEITNLVRRWIEGVNNGCVLKSDNENIIGRMVFYSSDYTSNPSLRPRLQIVYSETIEGYTTEIIQPGPTEGKDAFIVPGQSNNEGNKTHLYVGRYYSVYPYDALIQFNLPSIGSCVKAELILNCSGGEDNALVLPITVHKITANWDESTVMASNKPPFETKAEDIVEVTGPGEYKWDITTLVNEWLANGNNYGVYLQFDEATITDQLSRKVFYSSEYTDDALKRPKLVLTYKETGGTVVTLVIDTVRPLVKTTQANIDTTRPVAKSVQMIVDTVRQVTVATSIQLIIDALRRVTKSTQSFSDTKRPIIKLVQSFSDTKRPIIKSVQRTEDTKRSVIKSVQGSADTIRDIARSTQLTVDTKRKVSVMACTTTDTFRAVTRSITNPVDTLRTVRVNIQNLVDTQRRTVAQSQTTTDTKRKIVSSITILADTYRKTIIQAQVRADTERKTLVTVQATLDTFRMVTVTVQSLFDALRQVIKRVLNYGLDYVLKELPERYTSTEIAERYTSTEIPSRYTWKELG